MELCLECRRDAGYRALLSIYEGILTPSQIGEIVGAGTQGLKICRLGAFQLLQMYALPINQFAHFLETKQMCLETVNEIGLKLQKGRLRGFQQFDIFLGEIEKGFTPGNFLFVYAKFICNVLISAIKLIHWIRLIRFNNAGMPLTGYDEGGCANNGLRSCDIVFC